MHWRTLVKSHFRANTPFTVFFKGFGGLLPLPGHLPLPGSGCSRPAFLWVWPWAGPAPLSPLGRQLQTSQSCYPAERNNQAEDLRRQGNWHQLLHSELYTTASSSGAANLQGGDRRSQPDFALCNDDPTSGICKTCHFASVFKGYLASPPSSSYICFFLGSPYLVMDDLMSSL